MSDFHFSVPLPEQIQAAVRREMSPRRVKSLPEKSTQENGDGRRLPLLTITFFLDGYPAFPEKEHCLKVIFEGNKKPSFSAKGKFQTCLNQLNYLAERQSSTGRKPS